MRPVQRELIEWWSREGRDLPWRRSRDPWAVLVSELMLQQTQVSRVTERYVRFLERFPTVVECAAAPVGDVIDEWAGLGYNRRAVHLHRTAVRCVEHHDGALPDTLTELLDLPGVGPYTARAVLVFAHERDIGLVDTNAGRFVARALAGRPLPAKEAQAVADAAVPGGWGWTWGQAVFDLGASVCRKRAPRCGDCPIRLHCAWATAGFRTPDPIDGSAGISARQSRFDGSDRQGRGRLVDAMRAGPVEHDALAAVMGWPDDQARAARVAAGLVADGLAVVERDRYRLP
ncbi:A/G-specific adenine glycosylase [Acidimicrobiia bacterium EGI L10123]|uniref:A/G-specific adenine glycosylase n=1 Tax=Salinilacustrithrix flava TaxID=2957203 RepID=UPI003D7C208F|nr:A/G-specific adenine glycosylase [Acidimicrobiia bacterium EGI L10123]